VVQRVAVIGLGQFGSAVARTLHQMGAEVLGIDRDERVVAAHDQLVAHAIALDATDERAFRDAGVADVDLAVVAIARDLGVSILVMAQLVKLAIPHVVGRASSPLHEQILRIVGAHEVVNPEDDAGMSLAQRLLAPGLHGRVLLPSGHEWAEVAAPPSLRGKRISELGLREQHGVHLLAVKRVRPRVDERGQSTLVTDTLSDPGPDEVIKEGDLLALVGTEARLRKLEH
jgi:trk system potassium uptake protein TrkA